MSFHAFAHRTQTNVEALEHFFGRGLASLPRLKGTRRPLTSHKLLACPCGSQHAAARAWYYAVGDKMVRSTPHLLLSCPACSAAVASSFYGHADFLYHAPMTAHLGRLTSTGSPVWNETDEADG